MADSHFVREASPPPKPKEWNRSTGMADSHFVREPSPPPKPKESNRDYKHTTDFTGPTVANTKVKQNRIDGLFYSHISF
jgi:hypothetical protein